MISAVPAAAAHVEERSGKEGLSGLSDKLVLRSQPIISMKRLLDN